MNEWSRYKLCNTVSFHVQNPEKAVMLLYGKWMLLHFRRPWYESVPPLDLRVLKSKEHSLSWHLHLLVQDLPQLSLSVSKIFHLFLLLST